VLAIKRPNCAQLCPAALTAPAGIDGGKVVPGAMDGDRVVPGAVVGDELEEVGAAIVGDRLDEVGGGFEEVGTKVCADVEHFSIPNCDTVAK